MGSEPGMGWNWCVNLANYCELYIITETEFKEQIESRLASLPQDKNMHFYWLPAGKDEAQSAKNRRMCWNQGDWRFYYYYKQWQKRAAEIARQICQEQKIDILHQLNMVGFREPGMLYKINEQRKKGGKNVKPLVWGPIAGYGSVPSTFMMKGGIKFTAFYTLKNILNYFQFNWHKRVRKMIRTCDALICATPPIQRAAKKYHNKESLLISETGCFPVETSVVEKSAKNNTFDLLWVGRFLYTKQLEIALEVVKKLEHIDNLSLHIVGQGSSPEETLEYKQYAQQIGVADRCVWHGQIPNQQVQQMMRTADLFFFTSIFEATSTVVLEAVSNNLPVLCFDACGMAAVIDESVGMKIPLTNPEQSVKDFAEKINFLYHHPEELQRMSANCPQKAQELSWDNKAKQMVEIYQGLI